ncbi:ankyrin repeat domain-containing protein [Streptomyces sp. NPDC046915]|uniref:ankyrin repeat domain-containing protein n=1 Tax=Streptomyces sp. NPDC046915 TaxID=3155257 RepID=UPI0033D70125
MTTDELVAAVRRGDADRARRLLDTADPDTVDPETGLPLLCTAVAACDEEITRALVDAGADPLRPLPDGSTPLLRAVDGGSVEMVDELLDPRRIPAPLRAELLARARHWAETGVEAELRRRAGEDGPVRRERVMDRGEYAWCTRFSLGGLTARDGHLGILTCLEDDFGVPAPFEGVLARALAHGDRDHAVWGQAGLVLARRLDEETWQSAVALSRHPERLHRLFAAELLLSLCIGGALEASPFDGRGAEVLLPWAREERDPEVLRAVLYALSQDAEGPEIEALGLSYLAHPDPLVRGIVPHTLERSADRPHLLVRPESLAAVLTLARDPDGDVRGGVCCWLADYPGREPGITDALAGLVREDNQLVRIHAVYGLANRDDPRCVEGREHIGPVDWKPGTDTWMLDATDRYLERRTKAEGPVAPAH